MTLNWLRLMRPLFAARQAGPSCCKHASGVTSRKISATSSDGLGMVAYEGLGLPFLRLVWFRSSSGLSTAAIIPVATRAYRAVVVSLA